MSSILVLIYKLCWQRMIPAVMDIFPYASFMINKGKYESLQLYTSGEVKV